jgi:hypothetical protein
MTKLKKILLATSVALLSVNAVHAEESQVSCSAVTTCVSPFRAPYSIACQTYGQGCQWWTIPGVSVQCTGFDVYGRWANFVFRCL